MSKSNDSRNLITSRVVVADILAVVPARAEGGIALKTTCGNLSSEVEYRRRRSSFCNNIGCHPDEFYRFKDHVPVLGDGSPVGWIEGTLGWRRGAKNSSSSGDGDCLGGEARSWTVGDSEQGARAVSGSGVGRGAKEASWLGVGTATSLIRGGVGANELPTRGGVEATPGVGGMKPAARPRVRKCRNCCRYRGFSLRGGGDISFRWELGRAD